MWKHSDVPNPASLEFGSLLRPVCPEYPQLLGTQFLRFRLWRLFDDARMDEVSHGIIPDVEVLGQE